MTENNEKNLDTNQVETDQTESTTQDVQLPPLKPTSRRKVRALAFHYVYAVDRSSYEVEVDDVVEQYRDEYKILVDDNSFALELARGAVAHRDELDEIMKPRLKNWKLNRLGCCTRLILRMAIWEIKFFNQKPFVAINEAVELAKAFAEKDAYRFVNGVLDELARDFGFDDNQIKVQSPDDAPKD